MEDLVGEVTLSYVIRSKCGYGSPAGGPRGRSAGPRARDLLAVGEALVAHGGTAAGGAGGAGGGPSLVGVAPAEYDIGYIVGSAFRFPLSLFCRQGWAGGIAQRAV